MAFARKASDTIDNRFGEMNQDNIFWQRWQKQLAQTSLLSYSYTLGSTRMGVGATRDAALFLPRAAKGQKAWTVDLSYALALPIVIGTVGAAYQYLRTGKAPSSVSDLFTPQTGATDPSTGKPERARIPSYMTTVFSLAKDPSGELGNKFNPVWKNAYEAMTNKDWRGDVIGAKTSPLVDQMAKRFEHVLPRPIMFDQQSKGGSAIGGFERFLGVRPAGMDATDPEGLNKIMDRKDQQEAAVKALHDLNGKRAAKGLPPLRGRGASEYIRHWQPGYGGTTQ